MQERLQTPLYRHNKHNPTPMEHFCAPVIHPMRIHQQIQKIGNRQRVRRDMANSFWKRIWRPRLRR
jgi:hypothetical protein